MYRIICSLGLLLVLPACTQNLRSSASLPLAPEVYQQINREAQRGRAVVEFEDTRLRAPTALRLTPDSVRWSEQGVERRASVAALRCIRISARKPTWGERVARGALSTLAAGAAMTAYFVLTEEGGGAPGVVGGMMINTILAAPLAFPAGFILAPRLMGSRTYDFHAASESAASAACSANGP